jgi:hypothetical protein
MLYAGPGQIPTLKQALTNEVALPIGGTFALNPAGWYFLRTGKYSSVQQYDPFTGAWRRVGGGVGAAGGEFFYSDGVNYRLANQSGCAVGALLTAAGSGYVSAPTVTASAGSSLWKAWVGGAISTTVTISNGGSGYTYPPIVVISAPPPITSGGGIQATAICALTGGVVTSVTVTNQGAGYPTAPTITFVNDPRENPNIAITGSTTTFGSGAAAVATLTGAGTVTGVVCQDHGTGLTAVPTLTFSGGGGSSAAATAIMDWGITGFAPTGGTGFTGASTLSGLDAFPTTASAYVNPDSQSLLVYTRQANILMPQTAGAPTATGAVYYDRGVYTSVPTPLVTTNGALITAGATFTFTMGGTGGDLTYVMQL